MRFKYILIVALLALVGIFAVIYVRRDAPPEQATTTPPPTQTPDAQTPDDAIQGSPTSFSVIDPEAWPHTERAERSVRTLAPNQDITLGVVMNPTNSEFAYFATQAETAAGENLVSVYSYNTRTHLWERLFRRAYGPGDFSGLSVNLMPAFHVLGYDDGRLVILVRNRNTTPEPCDSPLLVDAESNAERLVSMDIANPYGGFDNYALPEDIRREEEERQEACRAG